MRTGRWLAGVVATAIALTACGAPGDPAAGNGLPIRGPAKDDGRIHVVAAESLWGDIARQIGGAHVDVASILADPGQDPHEYQSGVADAAAIDSADVVIVNGAGYDSFMDRLLAVDAQPGRRVVTAAHVVGTRAGANPHLWYDPAIVLRVASAIEAALATEQPAHAGGFERGLAGFRSGEQRVVDIVTRIKARHAGARVGYTEPVPGYLVQAAGLSLGTPASFSTALANGTDPGPGDSARFEAAITRHRIHALLLNTQVGDPETQRLAGLARRAHVPVVSVTESLPRRTDFQTWQSDQAASLLRALDG